MSSAARQHFAVAGREGRLWPYVDLRQILEVAELLRTGEPSLHAEAAEPLKMGEPSPHGEVELAPVLGPTRRREPAARVSQASSGAFETSAATLPATGLFFPACWRTWAEGRRQPLSMTAFRVQN